MRYIIVIFALLVCGCEKGSLGGGRQVVEPDGRPAFVLDGSKPFVVELGRGSGMRGLDVVRVDETGAVELSRIAREGGVEHASVRLAAADVGRVVDLVNRSSLTAMARSYTDPRIADGTQWVLSIRQGASEKAVYSNNAFPGPVTAFAGGLDSLLGAAGAGSASWGAVPEKEGMEQQAALWKRIEAAR